MRSLHPATREWPRSLQLQKSLHGNEDPTQPKKKKKMINETVYMERILVLVVWIEDQTSHNILLSQSLTQSKDLSLFNSVKPERGEEDAKEKFEAIRGWFVRLMKKKPSL